MAKLEIKSKFDSEFRRISLPKTEVGTYEHFRTLIERLHRLVEVPFVLSYTDPKDGDLLPINNDDNLGRAVLTAKPLLRIIIQRKVTSPVSKFSQSYNLNYLKAWCSVEVLLDLMDGKINKNYYSKLYKKCESIEELNGYGTYRPRNIISSILGGTPSKSKQIWISNPQDFRQVSAIIDVDVVPETCRRVRLLKHGSERPLGFYIRDGTSVRVSPSGVEKVPGIFISRLVPGGLAESTGLLAVNDEVLEVNGIEVAGKTLDQVTDMMVANSHNLIVTVKPANQRATMSAPRRGSLSRTSQLSSGSQQSAHSAATTVNTSEEDDQDEVVDLTAGLTLHVANDSTSTTDQEK